MFAESMLEASRAHRGRRRWMTLVSFALQALAVTLLLLLPLWRTVGLPSGRVLATPISLGAQTQASPPVHRHATAAIPQSNLAENVLIAPRETPNHIAQISETVPPPQLNLPFDGVQPGGGRSRDGIWKSLGEGPSLVAPAPAPATAASVRPFRSSNLLAGSLMNRVQPTYPYAAKIAHVQGQVLLDAVISKDGTIGNLRVVEGHPLLVRAAVEAVSRWRYRPYILNGEPVEVETRILVNFTLAGG